MRGVRAVTVETMLVLCDLDATLLDREASYERWAGRLGCRHGLRDEALASFVADVVALAARRPGAEVIVSHVQGALGGDEQVDLESFKEGFARASVLAPGVGLELSKLRSQGARIAVVTNGEAALQRLKIAVSGLEALVDEVVISGAEGVAKPDPALLAIAARRCELPLAGAWMVGDQASTDIQAAAAAGISSVWVDHGQGWAETSCAPTHRARGCAGALALVSRQLLPRPRSAGESE